MTREEFHRIYEKMPEGFKAELIGGIVYVSPPLRLRHGQHHTSLGTVFFAYEGNTPGVQSGDNATVILSDESEPQPDLFLRILPEFGGQSKTTVDDYLGGPPELVAEIAYSTQALDLHAKRQDYARHGILEYLVLSIKERQLKWFDLRADKELTADADGVCRVRVFPGLWIHVEGLLSRNYQQLMATLKLGLETREHAAFIKELEAAHKK
jgi:Uma2 family endonuclease